MKVLSDPATQSRVQDGVGRLLADPDKVALLLGPVSVSEAGATIVHRQPSAVHFKPSRISDRLGLPGDIDEPDRAFDLVISANWHEHSAHFRWSLQEIARVLRPGGTAVILLSMHEGAALNRPARRRTARGIMADTLVRAGLRNPRQPAIRVGAIEQVLEEIGLRVAARIDFPSPPGRQELRIETPVLAAGVSRMGQQHVTMMICARQQTSWSQSPLLNDAAALDAVFRKNYGVEIDRLAAFEAEHASLLPGDRTVPGIGAFHRALVISPHPDDELIGAGGTILRLRQNGADVHVLQMTNGRSCASLAGTDERLRRSIRLEEAGKVADGLGVAMTAWQDQDDDIRPAPGLTARLLELLEAEQPDVVIVPFLNDPHADHRFANTMLCAALHQMQETPVKWVLSYEVWTLCPHNLVVDVSEMAERKTALLGHYRSALRVVNYARTSEWFGAWHAHRSLSRSGMAEVFLCQSVSDYLTMADTILAEES